MTSLEELKKKIIKEVTVNKKNINTFEVQELTNKFNCSLTDFNLAIKTLYLQACPQLSFEFYKTRNNIKIISIKENKAFSNQTILEYSKTSSLSLSEIMFISSPFVNVIKEEKIIDILELYYEIYNKTSGKKALFFVIENPKNLYDLLSDKYTYEQILELYNLIKDYGYSYIKNNNLYWKTANIDLDISDINIETFFSINSNDSILKQETEKINQKSNSPKREIENQEINIEEALNLIAKKLGYTFEENELKYKLEELIATTNELIISFDELEDWEKLKNWDNFLATWQLIIGDFINDRN